MFQLQSLGLTVVSEVNNNNKKAFKLDKIKYDKVLIECYVTNMLYKLVGI